MTVFPENMNVVQADDVNKALGTLDAYIRYMRERIEFSFANMNKTVTAAGVSSLTVYEELQEAEGELSSLASRLATLQGTVTSHIANDTIHVTDADKTKWNGITALTTRVGTAEANITNLTSRVGTAEGNITSLTSRVGTAEGDITSLAARIGTAEGDITNLTSRVGTNEGNISSMQAYITQTIDTALSNLDARVTALEGQTTP